jgi:opacity protein-like surface antigen
MHFVSVKNVKHLILVSTIFSAFMGGQKAQAWIPHGFYLGPSVATTSTTVSNEFRFNPQDIENAELNSRNLHGSTTQVQPGFFLGYEYVHHGKWLLSGEIQANYLKSFMNFSGTDYITNTLTTNTQYAVQLRAGRSLTENDNFIYALLGASWTSTDVQVVFANPSANPDQPDGDLGDLYLNPLNTTQNLTGFKFGFGYEKHISNHVAIRVDYSHTYYGNFKNMLIDEMFFDVMGPSGTSEYSQYTDMLGFTVMLLT